MKSVPIELEIKHEKKEEHKSRQSVERQFYPKHNIYQTNVSFPSEDTSIGNVNQRNTNPKSGPRGIQFSKHEKYLDSD